jgi:hypothetical protein
MVLQRNGSIQVVAEDMYKVLKFPLTVLNVFSPRCRYKIDIHLRIWVIINKICIKPGTGGL